MGMSELLYLIQSLQHRPANADEQELANEIVQVVESQDEPSFGGVDMDETVMLEMAFRESGFKRNAIGDHGHSLGYFQLQRVPRSILKDAHKQASTAYSRLQDSAKSCGQSAPLAKYASGNCGHGRVLSRFRMGEARRFFVKAKKAQAEQAVAQVEATPVLTEGLSSNARHTDCWE
jgi:hypothetical protein